VLRHEGFVMLKTTLIGLGLFAFSVPVAAAGGPTDPQIAHIAYTAGTIDIAAAKQALARSHNKAVRAFAQEMVRDHKAVNDKALALVKKQTQPAPGSARAPPQH
jgi:putative membrane protein